jgi:hypothetical protein
MSDLTHKVVEILLAEGHAVNEDEYFLEYSGFNISKRQISEYGNFIAWFESDYLANHRVKIYHHAKAWFEWEPVTYNPAFGCYCGYLNYHAGVLVLIYKEKHEAYIVAIDQQEVRYFKFHGEKFSVGNNLVYYQEYANMDNGVIGVISIPDLVVRDSTTQTQLAVLNLELNSI